MNALDGVPGSVALPAHVASTIVDHAQRERPRECCGLLLGTAAAITDAIPTRNVAEHPTVRYAIHPVEHFAAIRLARERGLEVVGAYHSHVHSQALPSETDRAEAFSRFLFVIVSLAGSAPDFAAWALQAGNFVPVLLVRTA